VQIEANGGPVLAAPARIVLKVGGKAYAVPTDEAGLASVVVTSPNALPYSATLSISASTGVADGGASLSSGLSQNAPNPFVGSTGIAFSLARPGRVSVAVYDVSGRRVATLAEGEHDAGAFDVSWDGRDDSGHEVAAGAYFVRMVGADSHFERKMTLLR